MSDDAMTAEERKRYWAERHAQDERYWETRRIEDVRRNGLKREAAKQPASGPKTVTISVEIDVTDLTDEMIDTIIRPGVEKQAIYLTESWQKGVRRAREVLERERWSKEWAAGSGAFHNATLELLQKRLFDGDCWHSEHAVASLSRGGWFHSGSKKRLHVHNVKVDEEHRGKGYGRKLMELVILRADLEGLGLELRVDPTNIPAVRLYESLGFVARTEKKPYCEGGIEFTLMVRKRTRAAMKVAA